MVQRIDTSISFLAATHDGHEPLHIFFRMCDEGREVSETEAGSGWGCAILGLRIQNLALLTCFECGLSRYLHLTNCQPNMSALPQLTSYVYTLALSSLTINLENNTEPRFIVAHTNTQKRASSPTSILHCLKNQVNCKRGVE